MAKEPWERWEHHVNERLGLDGTVASGATWKDKGDGATRDNYSEAWPLMVDAKTTERGSYSLKAKFLEDMYRVAKQEGKTFALPIKFTQEERQPQWVAVPFEDYAYLVEEHRKGAPDFTEEERALIRAVAKSVKGEVFQDHFRRILAKMGES